MFDQINYNYCRTRPRCDLWECLTYKDIPCAHRIYDNTIQYYSNKEHRTFSIWADRSSRQVFDQFPQREEVVRREGGAKQILHVDSDVMQIIWSVPSPQTGWDSFCRTGVVQIIGSGRGISSIALVVSRVQHIRQQIFAKPPDDLALGPERTPPSRIVPLGGDMRQHWHTTVGKPHHFEQNLYSVRCGRESFDGINRARGGLDGTSNKGKGMPLRHQVGAKEGRHRRTICNTPLLQHQVHGQVPPA